MKHKAATSSKKSLIIKKIQAFTLIEVIITLTILGLIFGSVMSVFLLYSTLWSRVEVNRLMQSNIKTIVEHIREDINENGINEGEYSFWSDLFADERNRLFIWENEYRIVQDFDFDDYGWTTWPAVFNFDICKEKDPITQKTHNCTLVKVLADNTVIPLSNSWVSFKNMNFHVSFLDKNSSNSDFIPKVTIFFEMSMATDKWIRNWLVEGSSINIQTTITQSIKNES